MSWDRRDSVERDQILVDHCLLGDSHAWHDLFLMCHPSVCAAIRKYLKVRNEELVDELAACVWHRIVQNKNQLLAKFCSAKGVRLGTFLGSIARNVVRGYLRAERRRRKHETSPEASDRSNGTTVGALTRIELDEFMQSLSPGEKSFVQWSVSRNATQGCFSGTRNYDYQLRYRSCHKLHDYFR